MEHSLNQAGRDYARPATLMLPERIMSPTPWVGHIPFAFWIIDVMRPRRFVELGTHSGNSFCAFLQAAAAVSATGEYFAVDHWQGDEHAGHYENRIYEDLKRYTETRYGRSSAVLRMTFDQALEHFADGSIDLLHIDGLHTYEAVRHDYDGWLPKMTNRGIVLLHDTAVQERDFGVHRLFAELAERYPAFEFTHSYGLGVVQTGTAVQPAPLAMLLRGEPDSHGIEPRRYFERLGDSLVDQYYLELLSEQVSGKEKLEEELAAILRRRQELESALASQRPLRPMLESHRSQMSSTWLGGLQFSLVRMILGTGLFDPTAYRGNAGLPEMDDVSLVQHYLETGEIAGLAPSRHFDPQFYREKYPDVTSQGMNLLLHYITYGRMEGRLPNAPEAADQASPGAIAESW